MSSIPRPKIIWTVKTWDNMVHYCKIRKVQTIGQNHRSVMTIKHLMMLIMGTNITTYPWAQTGVCQAYSV